MARGKCVVCEKKNVDISLPSGLVCTYCDAHFHSECSPTFAKIDSEVLVVVKKVCAPCPNCENGLRSLPSKLILLEKKVDVFITNVEATLKQSATTVPIPVNGEHIETVDAAVKEAVAVYDNRCQLIVSGLKETGNATDDISHARSLFDFLGVKDVVVVDALRLGRHNLEKVKTDDRPRLLKVRVANLAHKSIILQKAKMLKGSVSYKDVFVRPSYTYAERQRIRELYADLNKRNEAGVHKYYIDRRGPVHSWSVRAKSNNSSVPGSNPQTSSVPGANLPTSI